MKVHDTRVGPATITRIEVGVSKKWYSFFVVTDGSRDGRGSAPDREPSGKSPVRSETVKVEDLAPAAEVAIAPEAAVTGGASIADVYEAARIVAPPHGYTVLKVADMLQSEHIRSLPPEVKHKSVLVALDAAGVPVDEIVRDAVARDRALDTYERVLEQHVEELRQAKAAENQQLEAEMARVIAELRARIDANNEDVSREQNELQAWRVRKQREETIIAEAVSHFVSENPITTTAPPAEVQGDADVR